VTGVVGVVVVILCVARGDACGVCGCDVVVGDGVVVIIMMMPSYVLSIIVMLRVLLL